MLTIRLMAGGQVNGDRVSNMRQMTSKILAFMRLAVGAPAPSNDADSPASPDASLRIELEGGMVLVLDRAQANRDTKVMQRQYAVLQPVSDCLADLLLP